MSLFSAGFFYDWPKKQNRLPSCESSLFLFKFLNFDLETILLHQIPIHLC